MSTPKTDKCQNATIAPEAGVDGSVPLATAPAKADRNRADVCVSTVMLDKSHFPIVNEKTLLKEALEEMSRLNLGIACLVNNEGILTGIITYGDIRRKLLRTQKPFSAFFVDDAIDYAIRKPTIIASAQSLASAVELMGQKQIWDLPVVSADGRLEGLLHLHPAIEALLERLNYE
jgi:arabinose-5-phosphate isomerase